MKNGSIRLPGHIIEDSPQKITIEERNKIIEKNIGLVHTLTHKFIKKYNPKISIEDLVSYGCLGLLRAAEKFDESKGFKFSTYASYWIKQRLYKALYDETYPFKICRSTLVTTKNPKTLKAIKDAAITNMGGNYQVELYDIDYEECTKYTLEELNELLNNCQYSKKPFKMNGFIVDVKVRNEARIERIKKLIEAEYG